MKQVAPEDAFDVAYLDRLDAFRRELVDGLPPRGVAALALVPMWSERLLQRASVDLGTWTLERFLDEAERRRLCVRGAVQNETTWTTRRARVLMLLWPHLTPRLREVWGARVREAVHRVPPSLERLQFLVTLAATQSEVASEALEAVLSWPDREMSARLLARLAAGMKRTELALRAWSALDALHDAEERLSLRIQLLPCLPRDGPYIQQAEHDALALGDLEERARACVRLATFIDDAVRARAVRSLAFEAAREIADAEERCLALCGITTAFPASERVRLTDACLESAREIRSPITRAHMLARMAGHATALSELQTVARNTLAALRNLPGQTSERDHAVASLTVPLGAGVKAAPELADVITDPAIQLDVVAAMAAAAPSSPSGPMRDRVRQALDRLEPTGRWDLLAAFIPHVEPDAVTQTYSPERLAASIPDRQTWRSVVISVAACFEGTSRDRWLAPVLQSIRTVADERVLLHEIAQIAPHLSETLLAEACEFAWTMRDDRSCAMPDGVRADVLLRLGEIFPADAEVSLHTILCDLGEALMRVSQSGGGVVMAPATVRWAEIASRCRRPRVAGDFLARVFDRLVLNGETAEATEWYTTADSIAPIVGADLVPAISLGRRRVEVACRRTVDARHLQRYLHREDLEKAFQRLIDGNPAEWALHYIGMGGVGKTMLLRHVMANLAVRNGRPLPVARVDFDHMKPQYPVREPAVLLVQLADELRLFLPTGAEDRYDRFQDRVLELHGALSREPMPGNPLQNIHIDEFDRLLREFAALLDALPKPIIFILDTCEELAKLEPEGESIPAVAATFEILERVHARTQDLRVVFAGRRLLARAGVGWRAKESTLSHRSAILPEGKSYLQLQLIQGFSEEEADRYITQIAGLQIDPERRAAILRRSLDRSLPADIDRIGHAADAPAVVPHEARYNPFDISLYADWVLANPDVDVDTLGSGETDPYVEMRLLRRIQDEAVRRLVPAAILLREFDQPMMKPLLPADDRRATRVFGDLGGQEWIDSRGDVQRVEPNLLARLQDYYAKPAHRDLMASVRHQLAEGLDALVRDAVKPSPTAALSAPLLDAALRLLPAPKAAALWDAVDRHLTGTANWSTAERLCEVLLEQDHAAGGKDSPVSAAVRATLTAARIHNWPSYDATRDWKQVADAAAFHPDPDIRQWLTIRARLGQGEWDSELVSDIRLLSFTDDQWQREQLDASLIAATEARLARTGSRSRSVDRVRSAIDNELEQYWKALAGTPTWDLPAFPRVTVQRWADWRAPASIPDRVRLMSLDQESIAPDLLIARLQETIAHLDNIDAEVLASRLLELLLRHQPVPRDLLAEIMGRSIYDPNRIATADVHRKTPPLFVMVGEALIARGDGEGAMVFARTISDRARENQDARAAGFGGELVLRVMRRFRLPGSFAALTGLVRRQHAGSIDEHYNWVLRYAGSPAETRTILAEFDERLSSPLRGRSPDDGHAALDFVEANLLRRRIGLPAMPLPFADRTPDQSASPSLVCRWFALHDTKVPDNRFEGRRQRAEALLEEAELLLLRLPRHARVLLWNAYDAYKDANDPCGGTIAALCSCIALFKAGEEKHVREWLERASHRYEEFRVLHTLPPWNELSLDDTQRLRTDAWYAWLLRILLIRARIDEGAAGGPKTAAISAEIARFMGDEVHPDFSLTSFGDAPGGPSLWSWLRGVLTTMAQTALGLAIVFGAIYGVWKLIQWARQSETGQAVLIVLIAVIATPLALSWIFRWLIRGAVGTNNLRLEIATSAGRAELTIHAWLLQLPLPPFGPKTARTEMQLAVDRFRPYLSAALNAHDPVTRGLSSLRPMGLFGRPVVPLHVAGDAVHYCWEALLTLHLERPGQQMREPIAFLRAARSLPEVPAGWTRWSEGRVEIRSGAKSSVTTGFQRSWWQTIATDRLDPAKPIRVLHLIGRARRGVGGVSFTIAGDEPPLRIAELPLARTGIVVVQEESVNRLERLDVDREQTADTRQWAAEVFAAGAQTVVLIPALPIEIAGEGIRAMAEKWGESNAPYIWRLVDGVSALRRRIYQHQPSPQEWNRDMAWSATEALNELACEVTLFARHPGFRTQTSQTPR